jgi:hypothetical protein
MAPSFRIVADLRDQDSCHVGTVIALPILRTDGYRDRVEQYGDITMKRLMIVRPGMIAALCSLNLACADSSNMRPSGPCPRLLCPRLARVLGLIIIAGLSGCGPAVTEQTTSDSQPVSRLNPSPRPQQTPSPRNNRFTLAASPVTLAAPSTSKEAPAPLAQEEPVPLPEHLVLPDWIEQALEAPEPRIRLQALDLWAQQGVQAPLDPLIVALDDENADVRTKAMALIEWRWAVEQAAKPAAAK